MPRLSFRDPVTGVLKAHGFITQNEPGDVSQAESDQFLLQPGRWRWNGTTWVAFMPPPTQDMINRAAIRTAIDALIADLTIPQKVRDFVTALRVIV